MAKKIKKISGFKMNKKTGHPSLAFKQKRDNIWSIGFSKKKDETFCKMSKIKNINPNKPNDPCFVKHKVEKYKSNNYKTKKEYKNYRIHPDDKKLIDKIKKGG